MENTKKKVGQFQAYELNGFRLQQQRCDGRYLVYHRG